MKKNCSLTFMSIAFCLLLFGRTDLYGADEAAALQTWFSHSFAKPANLPFSFQLGDELSPTLMVRSKSTGQIKKLDDQRTWYQYCYLDKVTGLKVCCECTVYQDFPAVEWVLHLQNTGQTATGILQDLQALDWTTPGQSTEPVLHYAKGAVCSWDDFQPIRRVLNKKTVHQVQPGGGRSSSDYLPFFNLEQSANSGVIVAIGWSGEWQIQFTTDANRATRIRSGMAVTRLKLNPGEEIRSPRMALLFYQNGRIEAQNRWRQFLLSHHRPLRHGQPFPMPLFDGSWGATPAATHLDDVQKIIDADLAIDYYWIDAEWFGQGKWHQVVGDWRVKKELYPQGFKPISDRLHKANRYFLLWFEPERVCQGTPWYTELSDWLLSVPKEKRYYNWGNSQFEPDWVVWESRRNQICENDRLYNLADPRARNFLVEYISKCIDDFGIDCFRHDANIAPLEFWRAADSTDRQGMNEIRWVEGLYAFWDELLQRHPGLIIDNCASGGRRIDLESLSRTTPFWRTDYPNEAIARQCHTYGLAFWVPLNATGNTRPATDDLYSYRSTFSSSMQVDLTGIGKMELADHKLLRAKALLQQYHDLQKYFLGDYYPLTCYSQASDAWMAWQFHRPDLEEGMIQAFRRPQSISESGLLQLSGLDETAVYVVTDQDRNDAVEYSGRDLMKNGLAVTIKERPAAAVLIYKKKSSH